MQIVRKYPDGTFSWIDLATPDQEGAKAFYTQLFGWTADDQPLPMGGSYTMLKLDGYNVAGLGAQPPDQQDQGIPAYWSSYVSVDDVDATVAKATAAGGNALFPPMDVMDEGRMTMIADPAGAMFGLWQAKNHIGAQVVNQPGALVWNELATRDVDGAKAFYNAVFGWGSNTDESNYTTFADENGRIGAGMIQMDDSWGEMPPYWGVYIMVDDVAATVGKAQSLGGNVMVPPTPAGEMGTFSVLQDPQGGVFTVMSFNGPVDSPPGETEEV